MSTYSPSVPTGLIPLDQDYVNLQLNFNQINNTYNTDHIALTDDSGAYPKGQNGCHSVIHLVPFSTTVSNPPNNYPITAPSVASSIPDLFSAQFNDGIATDEGLFFETGGSRLMQLTRNFTPTTSTSGATFLPGGLILNYGFLALNTVPLRNGGTITYTQPYPNACFTVYLTYKNDGSIGGDLSYFVNGAPGKTTFNYMGAGSYTAGSAVNTQLFYMAIGN
jgi:hypothetical protein